MKKKLKTRNRILLAVALALTAFLICTLAVYTYNGWQWDALFPYILGVGGVVDIATAGITVADKLTGRKTGKDE